MLESDLRTVTRLCRSSMAGETRETGLQEDSMQFYSTVLKEILGKAAPSPKEVHSKESRVHKPQRYRDGH